MVGEVSWRRDVSLHIIAYIWHSGRSGRTSVSWWNSQPAHPTFSESHGPGVSLQQDNGHLYIVSVVQAKFNCLQANILALPRKFPAHKKIKNPTWMERGGGGGGRALIQTSALSRSTHNLSGAEDHSSCKYGCTFHAPSMLLCLALWRRHTSVDGYMRFWLHAILATETFVMELHGSFCAAWSALHLILMFVNGFCRKCIFPLLNDVASFVVQQNLTKHSVWSVTYAVENIRSRNISRILWF